MEAPNDPGFASDTDVNWICSHCGEKFSRFRTRCPSDGQRVIEDLSGQLIGGRYRIRELIGVGGMDSTVWKAWQTGTERVVAVKVLPAAEEAAAKRFARGARIAANLNHPNCTVVHDYGRSEDGKLFLVMEFLAGQVLQEILGPEGMGVADAMHVADQVLQALEHAHGQRAVHRDLKPDNLFLCRKNDDPLHVKILDFGIAKYVEEDPENTASAEETPDKDDFEDLVTEQRQVCGTPQYMAPEQVVGARIDGRTDLYSLGCVMYRMLTGRLPFDGKTRYELYQKHLQEAPRPFAEVRPDLVFPERLELIVMKALSKRPDHRFQSASEMRKALESVELPEDRARRANRPRVSLKHTSPQNSNGPLPTVLPGGHWTLSAPSVAQRGGRAGDGEAGVTVLPQSLAAVGAGPGAPAVDANEKNPLVEVDPSLLGKRPPSLAGQSQLSRSSGAGNVVLSPSLVAEEGARAVRPPTGLLNDAVVRHPASRAPLGTSEVPRSSETEPNKLANEVNLRRRRLRVAAVLAAAFMVGVGGVALIMKLTQGGSGAGQAVNGPNQAPEAARPGTVEVAQPPRLVDRPAVGAGVALGAAGAAGAVVKPAQPAEVAPSVEVAPAEELITGRVAGEGLGKAPVYPRLELVQVQSNPPGATVTGPTGEFRTPGSLTLPPGSHRLVVGLDGYEPQVVEVKVADQPAAAGRAAPIEVILERVAPVAPAPGGPTRALQRTVPPVRNQLTRPVTPTESPTAPVRVETPPPDNRNDKPAGAGGTGASKTDKPQVRLLEDEPGAGKNDKKPTVRLLEDDAPEPEPKKPQVKVLGE